MVGWMMFKHFLARHGSSFAITVHYGYFLAVERTSVYGIE